MTGRSEGGQKRASYGPPRIRILSTKYFDTETGLYYYGYRYYELGMGRWVNRDPIGELGSVLVRGETEEKKADLNLYVFVLNNPINLIDLLALSEEDVQKMKTIFRQIVDEMTREGKRHSNPQWNNLAIDLYKVSGGRLGKLYLSCGEQETVVTAVLEKQRYVDNWSFDWKHYFIHVWGEAESDNLCDPIVIYDPWRNEFKTRKRQK